MTEKLEPELAELIYDYGVQSMPEGPVKGLARMEIGSNRYTDQIRRIHAEGDRLVRERNALREGLQIDTHRMGNLNASLAGGSLSWGGPSMGMSEADIARAEIRMLTGRVRRDRQDLQRKQTQLDTFKDIEAYRVALNTLIIGGGMKKRVEQEIANTRFL